MAETYSAAEVDEMIENLRQELLEYTNRQIQMQKAKPTGDNDSSLFIEVQNVTEEEGE